MITPGLRKKVKLRAWQNVINFNRLLGHYNDPVWLIGDGRSGTTWVSGLINAKGKMRVVFEPFHPIYVPELREMPRNLYVRPGSESGTVGEVAKRVFSGKLIGGRVDQYSGKVWHEDLLIKDIFSNLLAPWAVRRFSLRRTILLVRNPFGVAVSKFKKRSWPWMTDPANFLKQSDLMEDHLTPFAGILACSEDDYILRQVKIWAVLYLVPLCQFKANEICILVYEDLVENPELELRRIFAHIWDDDLDDKVRCAMSIVSRPSATTGKEGSLYEDLSLIDGWRSEVGDERVAHGLAVLDKFGMRDLVSASGRPIRQAFEQSLAQGI